MWKERSRSERIVSRWRLSAELSTCSASSSRCSCNEPTTASSIRLIPDSDCTGPSWRKSARRRRLSCSAVISWSESRARSVSRTCASARRRAFSTVREAKSASSAARGCSSTTSCRRRSVTIRWSAKPAAPTIATARPANASQLEPSASPTTETTAAAATTATRAAALVDDRFAKRNRDGMRTRVRLELGQDVAHVALDGLLADEEPPGDVGVGHPVGQELQDLPLAPGQHSLAVAGEECRHQRGVDEALAGDHLVDRLEQRLVRRLLEDVALGAGLEPTAEEAALAVGREDQDGSTWNLLRQDLRRLEPVHPGHSDVHDHDVGIASLGKRDRGCAVGGFADDPDMRGTRKRESKPLADDFVVIDDQAGDLSVGALWRGLLGHVRGIVRRGSENT